jgi:hypothetical protein
MAKRVPSNVLLNTGSFCSRPDDFGQRDVGPVRSNAVGPRTGEYPVLLSPVTRCVLPDPQISRQRRVYRYWSAGPFCLAAANNLPKNGSRNPDFEISKIDIAPFQCKELAAAKTGRRGDENHQTKT